MEQPVMEQKRTDLNGNAVELVGLHKRLGGRNILNGIDLAIRRGETHVIIGGSGTGKSVTLRTIIGLVKPDRGTVTVNGFDIGKSDREALSEIRKRIGYLFQGAALLNSIDIFENVALPLREHEAMSEEEIRSTVMEKLALVGLEGSERKMPSMLSGGMQKRAGLARAIVRHPDVILYDEPTSGLDPVTSKSIELLILDMRKKLSVTSIVVTHDMESAFRMADRVSMLYQGNILLTAPPREFQQSEDPVIRRFINGEIHE